MESKNQNTARYRSSHDSKTPREILMTVYSAMKEKGYDPVNQIVGYLLSGDPTYITSYDNARTKLRRHERYELIEALVINYLKQIK